MTMSVKFFDVEKQAAIIHEEIADEREYNHSHQWTSFALVIISYDNHLPCYKHKSIMS